ncbi:metalloprotease PmbA [Oleiagrimonas sp. MCCC 1A03011]|uniref:metalloprotease PmbA n=1 Tax=Oleiagrimonas sp. MCCC 1A03011 TaxID=1926883 RepID=UPI000DC21FBC|nr:metalloprotease PmbA [Oleiagrimonas sp. MCCC 1A03011]RAP57443.1 metalloprotease PmbA [Oleiagrimonas sp. MCCC 1A03011]
MNDVVLQSHAAAELDRLSTLAEDVITRAKAAGASQAEVSASVDTGLNVNVRLGEAETVERTQDRGFGLTVYFGKRKGSASTADLRAESIQATIDQACAIARYTEEDACAGLADADRMATEFPDLDLWHPWQPTVDELIAIGVRIEDAGRAVSGITNSEGASVTTGSSLGVYANSHGFVGRESATRHTMSCSLIAGSGGDMQRDYWYDSARSIEQWMDVEALGREAARRTLARCGARTLSTRQCPVLFAPNVARGLIGHLISAASGGPLYRRASFLLDHVGRAILPSWFSIEEQPHLLRGQGSSNFDAEGVATTASAVIREGVLQRYLLGSYAARKLGLSSTGNAGGPTNLVVGHGEDDFQAMLARLGTGLLLTEVMGQGVSLLTGDYSRGAAGFWVENGEIAYPVQEITIAANLRDMFAGIRAVGADVDSRAPILTGSILVDRMTVAGE